MLIQHKWHSYDEADIIASDDYFEKAETKYIDGISGVRDYMSKVTQRLSVLVNLKCNLQCNVLLAIFNQSLRL